MDTNTDNFVNDDYKNKTSGINNIFNYFSETFFPTSSNNMYDDEYNEKDLINSYDNIHKLSQMNIGQIYEYLNIDNLKTNNLNDTNMYNNKYFNTLKEANENKYEIDYGIEINKNEELKFMKLKKK